MGTVVLAANSAWNIVNFRRGLIRGLKGAGYRPIVVAPVEPAARSRAEQLGVEWIPLAIDRSGVNPLTDGRLLLQYRRLLERIRPVALLGFTIKPNIYGSMAATSLGIPAIPNVSGLGTAFIRQGPLQALVTRLYRHAFRKLRLVLFQNADDRQLFVSRRIVAFDQTRLVPGSGIDLDQFAPASLPGGPPSFLLIGRLLRDKGVREYAEAAKLLRETASGSRVRLLGPLDPGNRTAVGRAELDRWVGDGALDYLGSTDDVRPFIADSTCVVLPSYREGLPRSLLEAAAMARPLVATDVPGCRELVEEGVNGFLCAPADPVALANAMARIVHSPPSQLAAMGEASRRKVQERFSEALVIRAYLDALRQLSPEPD